MIFTTASITSLKLWGGIFVAIPTAIPEVPFTKRFGNLDGSTTGSFSVSSKFGAKSTVSNSSLLDANLTRKGDAYDALNETYVIFITENDVLRGGLPIYHINRIIEEMGKSFGDEAHIIYVNSQIKDDTALGKLMHDFTCTNPDDMNYPVLAQRVRYFKEDTKGVATMCRAFEEVREETKHEQSIEIAKSLLEVGKMTYEEIARSVQLPVEEVKALDTKKPA
mgnify:CR=1 FL=1